MKIYNESGRLSEDGKKVTEAFSSIANELIASGETPEDKRLIGSVLSSIIGDTVSNQVIK